MNELINQLLEELLPLCRERGLKYKTAEELPLLFDRFYKVEKSRPSAEGSGLGLAIARRIVELHDGEIFVEILQQK